MPTAAQLEEACDRENLAGVLIASPANPTGTMIEPERLAELTDVCRRRGMWFISDEIYHGLTYSGPPAETALHRTGRVNGARVVDGLTMLIGQARRAFQLFFDRPPPPPDGRLRDLLVT